MKKLILLLSHLLVGFAGFALGVYLLPVMTAEPAPEEKRLAEAAAVASYHGEFTKQLKGSDWLHWGEGKVSLGAEKVVFNGKLAPGPDYKLYLSPEFVEDEAGFAALKSQMIRVADLKGFDGFIIDLPEKVDIAQYTTVVVWCESFGEFITAARYR